MGDFAELGFSCAWPPPCGGRTEVVSARLNPSHGTIDVGGVCNFLGSVSSQQKFEVTDGPLLQLHVISSDGPVLQLCVTAQFYLESKGKYILEAEGAAAIAAKLLQSCPTLCDPIDGSPPGSSVHGIFQARVLEWVAIAFSMRLRMGQPKRCEEKSLAQF